MSDEPPQHKGGRRPYPPGTEVEIRNQFDRSWSKGFVVSSLTGDGRYYIARSSDGSVLPSEFDVADIRRVRKNSMWWV